MYTKEQVESAVIAKGYKWFTDPKNRDYDVNIVGIRNSETGNEVTNKFVVTKQLQILASIG